MKLLLLFFVAFIFSGCASHGNFAGPAGDSLNTSYGLEEKRRAVLGVKMFKELPPLASDAQMLSAQRCHQHLGSQPPSEAVLTDDLRTLAYAQGFDGMTDLKFSKESGLLKNCWYVHRVTALVFRLPIQK